MKVETNGGFHPYNDLAWNAGKRAREMESPGEEREREHETARLNWGHLVEELKPDMTLSAWNASATKKI